MTLLADQTISVDIYTEDQGVIWGSKATTKETPKQTLVVEQMLWQEFKQACDTRVQDPDPLDEIIAAGDLLPIQDVDDKEVLIFLKERAESSAADVPDGTVIRVDFPMPEPDEDDN